MITFKIKSMLFYKPNTILFLYDFQIYPFTKKLIFFLTCALILEAQTNETKIRSTK